MAILNNAILQERERFIHVLFIRALTHFVIMNVRLFSDTTWLTRFRYVAGWALMSLLLAVGSIGFNHALADDDVDWRQLHQDVQQGRIKSLSEILDALAKDWIGEVIDVDIEREDGRLIYEIELLGPQGQRAEFEIDAATGEILEIEGRNLRDMERR